LNAIGTQAHPKSKVMKPLLGDLVRVIGITWQIIIHEMMLV
jgi:hypothetical protein